MPKYRVTMSATINQSITIEADNEDDAIDRAYEEAPGDLCAHCAGWGQSWSRDLGEFEVDEDVTLPDGTVITAVQIDN